MSQQIERDAAGEKRKLDDLNNTDEEQPSTEKPEENPTKKLKSPGEVTALVSGGIYRVQCPELGDLFIRAGATGSFSVKAADLKMLDSQGNVVFPLPSTILPEGAEVELRDNESGVTTLTVLPATLKDPPPQHQSWLGNLFSEVIFGSSAANPLNIVGSVNQDTVITGERNMVFTGNGGRLKVSGSGSVIVQGSIQSIESDGTRKVKINGNVTGLVKQTGNGSIVVAEDVVGNITNIGGGTIEVKGQHKGESKELVNTRGTVKIGTGLNNGGIKEYYHTKNYKIIQL